MHKALLVALLSLASTTALGSAGHGSDNSPLDTSQPIDRTITLEAGDMWFTPDKLEIAPGQTVKFNITNTGKLEHEFVIGNPKAQAEHRAMMREMASSNGHDMSASHHHDNGQDSPASMPSVTVLPGETATLVWTAPEDIEALEFACNIPGHYKAGMNGDLQIKG
ncbi:cupredoxin domain-containing protein [Halomonas elongata]|uniref:cupredoxin domain-containing protein n=1 Tax=Halomonas elongata TaxID=2746 RepID=UPI00186B7EF4|nr:plastocyanin/azurin family copper-binding protein [Halomonas elongata]MBW5801540.1 cupredoxin domain-containing protein [Halomonas elongata]